MDKAAAGEKVLRLCVSRERAAELVGDQLEARLGAVRFWVGIAGLVLAFSWRTILALLFAIIAGNFLNGVNFVKSAHYMRNHGNVWFYQQHSPLFFIFGFAGQLWILGCFSLMRFGVDSLTKLTFAAALLASSAGWLMVPSHGLLYFIGLCLPVLLYSFTNRRRLPALLILLVVTGMSRATGILPGHAGRLPPLISMRIAFEVVSALLLLLLQTSVVIQLHKRLLRPKQEAKQA